MTLMVETSPQQSGQDRAKHAAGRLAADLVEEGMRVGLGTGSTAHHFVRALAERDLAITCAATSTATAELATSLGLTVVSPDEVGRLDVTVDGADEIAPTGELVKGGGGALLQEKLIATMSDRVVIIADDAKTVTHLGAFPLPIEVVRFGHGTTTAMVRDLLVDAGWTPEVPLVLRRKDVAAYVTDNGNHIVDAHLGRIDDPPTLARRLNTIPGVVENGLFIGLATEIVLGHPDGTATRHDLPLQLDS